MTAGLIPETDTRGASTRTGRRVTDLGPRHLACRAIESSAVAGVLRATQRMTDNGADRRVGVFANMPATIW
jgi:hypothetical protein